MQPSSPIELNHIKSEQLNKPALDVAKQLIEAGHQAFLVGGCIRDILLKKEPKDFDIATSAHPEEIQKVFKRCRLIGRRFRLAHVRVGKDIIEVATFRSSQLNTADQDNFDTSEPESKKNLLRPQQEIRVTSQQGILLRDNVYGTLDEDVTRRDFTINALYLNPNNLNILDQVQGIEDLKQSTIRLIGEPLARFREDPVRILRAIRFAAKLNFNLDGQTEAAIQPCIHLLDAIPPARRFEELLKLFLTGHALDSFQGLLTYDLLHYLLPITLKYLDQPHFKNLVHQALINTDERIATGKHVTPAFLIAVFLWPAALERQQIHIAQGIHPLPALQVATNEIFEQQSKTLSVPKRFSLMAKEIWEMQFRLTPRSFKRCESLVQQKRFRAGYDFLLLREESGEIESGLGDWWTEYQTATPYAKKKLVATIRQKIPHLAKNKKK